MKDTIDPRNVIDRTAEQELFANLVSFTTPARMLVISDKEGRGKSTLLSRLRYNCKYSSPAIPAGLVDLKELPDPSPFGFVERLIDSIALPQRFPKFFQLNMARIARDLALFYTNDATQNAAAPGSGAAFLTILPPPPADFTGDQEAFARNACINAFFDDLRVFSAMQPVAILLDHWELCHWHLREWILWKFLKDYCFNSDKSLRPDNLAIVVAGDMYDNAEKRSGIRDDEFLQVFKSNGGTMDEYVLWVRSLSDWGSEHVKIFLEQHGYQNLSDQDIDMVRDILKSGVTLAQICEVASTLSKS